MSTENLISADEAQKLLDAATRPNAGCTGVSAGWCPIHGDCLCRSLPVTECPLHAADSTHAEGDATALRESAETLARTVIALHAEVARLRTAAHAMGDAEETLARMNALTPGASVAYLKMDGRPGDSISADFDSDAAPRITLALSLLPGDPEPWQALVEYDGGMGAIPVVSGECCERASAALASLQEEIVRGHGGTDE